MKGLLYILSFFVLFLLISPVALAVDIQNCFDSDKGQSLFVKGTLLIDENIYYDECVDSNKVKEYNCVENLGVGFGVYACPEGCIGGACVKPAEKDECMGMNITLNKKVFSETDTI